MAKKAQVNKTAEYTRRKRELNALNLEPLEYMAAVKKLAKELGM